jgi:hypothetical protein
MKAAEVDMSQRASKTIEFQPKLKKKTYASRKNSKSEAISKDI